MVRARGDFLEGIALHTLGAMTVLWFAGSLSINRLRVLGSFLFHSNEQAEFPYSFKFLN